MKNACRICGVKFETKSHNRKVCENCVDKIYPKIKTMKKSETCLICGKPIENTGKREWICWKWQQEKAVWTMAHTLLCLE